MLLVNGDHDSQMPIADLDLLPHAGSPPGALGQSRRRPYGPSADWPDVKIFREVVAPWITRQVGADAAIDPAPDF